jgi:hypothetical protein
MQLIDLQASTDLIWALRMVNHKPHKLLYYEVSAHSPDNAGFAAFFGDYLGVERPKLLPG